MNPKTRLALVLAAVLLVAQLAAYADYFTDDSWIYARFASNLAAGDGLVFNPGERIHAATSPLWALLVAGLVGLGLPLVAGMKLLGGACALGALASAAFIAQRRFGGTGWTALLVLLLATEPWFVRWSASGMETALAVFLLLLALHAGLRPIAQVAWGRLGWSLGLLPLVRPETLVLVALVGLVVLLRNRRAPSARFWAGMLVPTLGWAAFAIPYYGAVLPATLQAKSTPLGFVPARMLANLSVLARLFAVALALPALGWIVSLVRRPGWLLAHDDADWMRPALVLWSVALPAAYLIRDVQVVSRYLEVLLPVVLVLGLDELRRWPGQKLLRGLILVELAAALLFTFVRVVPSANAFGRSLHGLVEVGEWLRQNSPQEAVVAAYDIGAVGQASDRRILDLGGLVHAGINDLRNEVDDARILHEGLFLEFGRPAFLIDRDRAGAVLDGRVLGGLRCEPVLSRTVDNLGLTRPEPVVYTLYRLVPSTP